MGSENSGPRGRVNNPRGRPVGSKNKVTEDIRLEFQEFLHHASPKIVQIWEQLLEENPKEALSAIKDYAEFVLPKLSRVDMDLNAKIENISEKLADFDDPE